MLTIKAITQYIEAFKMAIVANRKPKFEVGQIVFYKGRETKVTNREIKETLQRTIVWEYNINFYVYKVPEYELVAEDATPLSVDEVDFNSFHNIMNYAICPCCRKYNFDGELFDGNEDETEVECPVCKNKFKLEREFVPFYSFGKMENINE